MPGRFEFKEQAYFNGVPFDVIGVSCYSHWHGSLDALQYNLNDITARYDKDVIVVETAYPFTLENRDCWPNIIGYESRLTQTGLSRHARGTGHRAPRGDGHCERCAKRPRTGHLLPGRHLDPRARQRLGESGVFRLRR